MDSRGVRPLAITTPGSALPPFAAVVGMLLHLFVYFVALLYSNENKVRKPVATTHGDVHCCTDGPVRKGLMGQQPLFINPERLKDFGEDDEHNGEVETWEMKIISHNDELLLRDSNSMSLSTYSKSINFEDISAAAFKIQGGVQKTPCMYSRLSKQYGVDIYIKKEFLQYTGSVKERGALCLLMSLQEDQKRNGVVVASDSNFTMAVAFHASEHQIPVLVIMSTTISPARVKMCRDYGAMVISYGATAKDSHMHARRLAQENGYLYLQEDDDAVYLAGLGTVALEIYEQVPKLDAVIIPGGAAHCGLLASSAAALKHLSPNIRVIGVESESFPVLQESLKTDGCIEERTCGNHRDISGPCLGTNSFHLTRKCIDKVVTVREEDVLISMLRFLEYERATVDAEGATGLAAVVAGKLPELKGRRVAIVVCSGNLELPLMRRCIDRALTLDNRVCKFSIVVSDSPSDVSKLLEVLAREEARALDVKQEHLYVTSELFTSKVTCIVETRDKIHTAQLKETLKDLYPMMLWME